jgi:hypothetical protein
MHRELRQSDVVCGFFEVVSNGYALREDTFNQESWFLFNRLSQFKRGRL